MTNILFLHGWGGDDKSFSSVLPYFRTKYNCICVAMPRETDEPWTLEDYARMVFAELDRLGIKQTHIIAHSFGARVTAVLANEQPERFGKLILAGPAGIKQRFNLWRWLRVRLHKAKIIKSKGSADYSTLSHNGKITFQNIVRRDLSAEISAITQPSLIIWGKKDKAIKKYMAKRWTNLNACITMKTYKNAGHFCFLDEPARFIIDVEEFLDA